MSPRVVETSPIRMGDGRDAALTRCGTSSDFFDLFKAFTPGDMGRRLSLMEVRK
jgi:hypothetical protein